MPADLSLADPLYQTCAARPALLSDQRLTLGTGFIFKVKQLCIYGFGVDGVIDTVDLFKTTRLFRKPILCRRIRMEPVDFLKLVNDGKHELEFLWEFHRPGNGLYQCWLWKKNRGIEAECQFEITAKSIEYRWKEILPDREW